MAGTGVIGSSTFKASEYSGMTDSQLHTAISSLTGSGGGRLDYVSPAPQQAQPKNYLKNIHTWTSSVTPPPKTPTPGTMNRANRQSKPARSSALATTPQPPTAASTPPLATQQAHAYGQGYTPNPPRPPIPPRQQALQSSYASRLRTGSTLLVQPIFSVATATATRQTRRGGGVVNYADPGSGDEFPDAGALESDDSDFQASGGLRTSIRTARARTGAGQSVFHAGSPFPQTISQAPPPHPANKADLDQSYLGMVPPAKYIKSRPMPPTAHEYPTEELLAAQASRSTALLPVRVEFETDTHRIRDCFVWNLNETLISPEAFARTFCADLDLPANPWVETVANQIRAQIEDHEGVASMELGVDEPDKEAAAGERLEMNPECRVFLSIDVQIATFHLVDHIEWDLLSPLSPEAFSTKLCAELGLSGEAVPLIAHAIHEELMKHKKDAIEWGVIGGEREPPAEEAARDKDKGGAGLVKDKTGLGLGWARAPKDGRGPKALRSVWRDWADAEEFGTTFELLSAEEVERREIERERASRRLRRETSKFQSSARVRRR